MQKLIIGKFRLRIELVVSVLLILSTLLVAHVEGAVSGNSSNLNASVKLNLAAPIAAGVNGLIAYGGLPAKSAAGPLYRTAPADLPTFTVTKWPGETADGYIFMAYYNYWQLTPTAYLLILDDNGEPIFYKELAPVGIAMDFKKQPNGLLTYYPLEAGSRFLAMDNSYQVVRSYTAGNGYQADFHDFQILENGNALLMIHDSRIVDMSQIVEGGDPEAEVIGCIIQEIDEENNVVFEWQSWGEIPITDSNITLTDSSVNYMNCNSLELDNDGNILLSSRNLDEVTKIDRQTGEIIWRLGVRQNDFTFTNDMGFNYAHDARRLENGNISIFDNGIAHSPPYSRGIEYKVDEEKRTVTRIREYRNDPDVYSRALGNMQQLPNGNMMIGWGRSIDIPVFTEFDINGQRILEFRTRPGHGSYRVFRFPWQGFPNWPPQLVVETDDGAVKLFFSWNGSTETTAFQIYRGTDRNNLELLTTVEKTGFETTYEFNTNEQALWYFQVVPVDGRGATGVASSVVPLAVGAEPIYIPMSVNISAGGS